MKNPLIAGVVMGGDGVNTGKCVVDANGLVMTQVSPATITTGAAVTYSTAEVLGGLILRDPAGAGRTDVTPTAAQLVAACPGVTAGSSMQFTIRNTADQNETITLGNGTGVTISGTATIGQNNSKTFLLYFSNVTSGSEAVTVYSLGTVVH